MKHLFLRNFKIRIISVITALVIIITVISSVVYFGIMNTPTGNASQIPKELADISPISAVEPTCVNGDYITTDSEFKITTSKPMSKSEFSNSFTISPETDYTISKTSGNTFSISFNGTLGYNTLYTVSSLNGSKTVYRWAFQTDSEFNIISHFPESGETDINSSISVLFSHSDVLNFEECFSIYPSVSGTFEHHGKLWSFIPATEFEKNTLYTVTINASVCRENGETLDKDYTFTFTASNNYTDSYICTAYSSHDNIDSFLKSDTPVATIISKNESIEVANVNVYSVPDENTFIEIHKKHVSNSFISKTIFKELENLDKVISFTSLPESREDKYYIRYPQSFEPGYYISEIVLENSVIYHIFQVTEFAVYTVTSNGDYTVWVNSVSNKNVLSGAMVTLDGFDSVLTDESGLATFNNASENIIDGRYLKVEYPGTATYITRLISTYENESDRLSIDYYSCVYADSKLYKSGDIVKVWGFILPRASDKKIPDKLELYCNWTDKFYTIAPDDNGSFSAQIKISEQTMPTYSYISLTSNSTDICFYDLQICDYTLPTYTLDITTDKDTYFAGETIKYTVFASLFDGTPASNVSINIFETEETITTDKNGFAYYEYTVTYYENQNSILSLSFEVLEPDGTSEIYYSYVDVLLSDVIIEVQTNTSSEINILMYTEDNKRTKKMHNGTVNAELHKITYEKEQINEIYDPVEMSVKRTYNYTEIDDTISTSSYQTENGQIKLVIPEFDSDAQYYYLFTSQGIEHSDAVLKYYITESKNSISEFDYILTTDKSEYTENDTVFACVISSDTNEKITDGTTLLTFSGGDILSNKVFNDSNDIHFNFEKEYIPDVSVIGAYFDGTKIKLIERTTVLSKTDSLNISITPDKSEYAPGDTVTLDIAVTDSNGNKVPAYVNVSVIDSALYSMYAYSPTIVDTVYFSRSNIGSLYRTVSTYTPEYLSDLYGEGGGGGIDTRDDFDDSPYFETVCTDKNGKSTVIFVLPDSVTSWTVSARAYTDTAAVGEQTKELCATKDLFMTVYLANTIKASDDTVIPFRFNGKELTGNLCNYTVTLFKDDVQIAERSGVANIGAVITENFGIQETGKYKVRIYGKCENNADAADYTFEIKEAYNVLPYSYKTTVLDAVGIDSTKFSSDIVLNIYDEEYDFYFTLLDKLSNLGGNRIEKQISSAVANSFLYGQRFGDITKEKLAILSEYQNSEMGIQLYNSDSFSTVWDSARITAASGKYFNKDTQIQYFENVILTENDPTNILYAYWALASLEQPVLTELNSFKAQKTSLNDEQTLCLALAYAYAGDYITAAEIYNENISLKIKSANGIAYYPCSTADETFILTRLTSTLASRISASNARDLVKWLITEDSNLDACCLEVMEYLKNCIPYFEGENTVTLNYVDGRSEKITYTRIQSVSIKIPYSDIDRLTVSSTNGTSTLTICGYTPADTIQKNCNNISNICDVDLSFDDTIKAYSITTLSLSVSLPANYSGDCTLSLTLPYNLKYISSDCITENGYCIQQNGQNIEVNFTSNYVAMEITVYNAVSGNFNFEPIILTCGESYAATEVIPIITGSAFN